MNRNILLVEPNYKNKFPPVALMKLATYHKNLGDNVIFYKGNIELLISYNLLMHWSVIRSIINSLILPL